MGGCGLAWPPSPSPPLSPSSSTSPPPSPSPPSPFLHHPFSTHQFGAVLLSWWMTVAWLSSLGWQHPIFPGLLVAWLSSLGVQVSHKVSHQRFLPCLSAVAALGRPHWRVACKWFPMGLLPSTHASLRVACNGMHASFRAACSGMHAQQLSHV